VNVPAVQTNGDVMESVLLKGDLSKLSAQERANYYMTVCRTIGLNPTTQPLAFITLNGKMVLYALRAASDQLRKIHGISIEVVSRELDGELFTVHVRAKDKTGRTDEDFGVVTIGSLKGEARANAILKGVTKAKRRVTLSIAGLGFLDETEVEDIPAAAKRENPHVTRPEDLSDARPRYDADGTRIDWIDTSQHRVERLTKAKARPVADVLNKAMRMCMTPAELVEWGEAHGEQVASLPIDWEEIFQSRYQEYLDELRKPKNVLQAG